MADVLQMSEAIKALAVGITIAIGGAMPAFGIGKIVSKA
ncbi:ATP F0F1 synthase subunit C, partial [Candidatus Beckwithbacteria bacterium]|nr:ATP F0F1 synthase subunit C [Candidatus Beckwithbacteria bacterium]